MQATAVTDNTPQRSEQIVPQAQPQRFGHHPFLDGLRGFGMLFMLQFHSQGVVSHYLSGRGGWWYIELFFVLSGFLITSVLLDEQGRTKTVSLKNFYIRRALRLLPALFVFMIAVAIINPSQCDHLIAAGLVATFYMSDFDVALGWGHVSRSGLDITWSLSVEEKYYAMWPAAVKFLRKKLIAVTLTCIAACWLWRGYLALHGATWFRLLLPIDMQIDSIMLGSLSAVLLWEPKSREFLTRHLSRKYVATALFITLFVLMKHFGHPSTLTTAWSKFLYFDLRLPIFSILSALAIISLYVTTKSWTKRLLSTRFLTWVGDISYSLYLWHSVAFWVIAGRIAGVPAELSGWTLAFAFAAASNCFIEKPFMRMRKLFSVDKPKAARSAPEPASA